MKRFIVLALINCLAEHVSSSNDDADCPIRDQTHSDQKDVSNYYLKTSAFHFPPFFVITPEREGNNTYSGYSVDVLDGIAQHLKLSLTYIPVNQSEVTKYGIIQAIINQLVVSKEVEIIPMVLIPTEKRFLMMDFTMPVLIGKYRLMIRYPEEQSQLTAIRRPFTFWTWVAGGGTALVFIAAMIVVNEYENRLSPLKNNTQQQLQQLNRSIWEKIGWNFLFFLSITFGQGVPIPYTFLKFTRFLIGLWCCWAITLGNAYTSTLTSFLAIPKLKPTINSLEELAASNHYKLTAELNSATNDIFLKATSGHYKIIGDSLRQNPHLLFRDYAEASKNVLKKDAVYMRGSIEILTRIRDDMRANSGKCRLTASKPMGDIQFLSFGLTKGHPDKRVIDRGISHLTESGLMNYWFNQYLPNIDKCLIVSNHAKKINQNMKSINLHDASGIFLLLGIGYSAAFLTLFCEILFPKR